MLIPPQPINSKGTQGEPASPLARMRQHSLSMKQHLEEGDIKKALNAASNELMELRESLSYAAYGPLYNQATNDMKCLHGSLRTLCKKGVCTVPELFEYAQGIGYVIPRSYLLIAIGALLQREAYDAIPSPTTVSSSSTSPSPTLVVRAPAIGAAAAAVLEEVTKVEWAHAVFTELLSVCRGVVHPVRGLFLRHLLISATRGGLPGESSFSNRSSEAAAVSSSSAVSTKISALLLLDNLKSVLSLLQRLRSNRNAANQRADHRAIGMVSATPAGGRPGQPAGQPPQPPTVFKNEWTLQQEKQEMEQFVAPTLRRLANLEGLTRSDYVECVFPVLADAVVRLPEPEGQYFLLTNILYLFPADFHLYSLAPLIRCIASVSLKADPRHLFRSLLEAMANCVAEENHVQQLQFASLPVHKDSSLKSSSVLSHNPSMSSAGSGGAGAPVLSSSSRSTAAPAAGRSAEKKVIPGSPGSGRVEKKNSAITDEEDERAREGQAGAASRTTGTNSGSSSAVGVRLREPISRAVIENLFSVVFGAVSTMSTDLGSPVAPTLESSNGTHGTDGNSISAAEPTDKTLQRDEATATRSSSLPSKPGPPEVHPTMAASHSSGRPKANGEVQKAVPPSDHAGKEPPERVQDSPLLPTRLPRVTLLCFLGFGEAMVQLSFYLDEPNGAKGRERLSKILRLMDSRIPETEEGTRNIGRAIAVLLSSIGAHMPALEDFLMIEGVLSLMQRLPHVERRHLALLMCSKSMSAKEKGVVSFRTVHVLRRFLEFCRDSFLLSQDPTINRASAHSNGTNKRVEEEEKALSYLTASITHPNPVVYLEMLSVASGTLEKSNTEFLNVLCNKFMDGLTQWLKKKKGCEAPSAPAGETVNEKQETSESGSSSKPESDIVANAAAAAAAAQQQGATEELSQSKKEEDGLCASSSLSSSMATVNQVFHLLHVGDGSGLLEHLSLQSPVLGGKRYLEAARIAEEYALRDQVEACLTEAMQLLENCGGGSSQVEMIQQLVNMLPQMRSLTEDQYILFITATVRQCSLLIQKDHQSRMLALCVSLYFKSSSVPVEVREKGNAIWERARKLANVVPQSNRLELLVDLFRILYQYFVAEFPVATASLMIEMIRDIKDLSSLQERTNPSTVYRDPYVTTTAMAMTNSPGREKLPEEKFESLLHTIKDVAKSNSRFSEIAAAC